MKKIEKIPLRKIGALDLKQDEIIDAINEMQEVLKKQKKLFDVKRKADDIWDEIMLSETRDLQERVEKLEENRIRIITNNTDKTELVSLTTQCKTECDHDKYGCPECDEFYKIQGNYSMNDVVLKDGMIIVFDDGTMERYNAKKEKWIKYCPHNDVRTEGYKTRCNLCGRFVNR